MEGGRIYGELRVEKLAEHVMGEEGKVERRVRKKRKDAGLGRKPYVKMVCKDLGR